jgi:hypothetical protein
VNYLDHSPTKQELEERWSTTLNMKKKKETSEEFFLAKLWILN